MFPIAQHVGQIISEMQPNKVPVFVFPHSITFIVEDKSSHKQILSLYNPYDYPIRYKILSTAPEKYIVNTPQGVILSRHRVDVVVRLNDVKMSSNCDVVDKFRIEMLDKVNHESINKQDITATLKSEAHRTRSITPEKDDFQTMLDAPGLSGQHSSPNYQSNQDVTDSPSYVILVIAIVCVVGLFLPTEKEGESASPFQISYNLKLVCAYVLGLVTFEILRTR